jgi:hypothetical protein
MNDDRTWTWCYDPLNPIFCPKARKERKKKPTIQVLTAGRRRRRKTNSLYCCSDAQRNKGTNKQTNKRI